MRQMLTQITTRPWLRKPWIKFGLLPGLFYLLALVLLTWPWMTGFFTAFMGDAGDTMTNVWNVWWVGQAFDQQRDLWFTPYLFAPEGTSLHGHTLNLVNAVPASILDRFLPIEVTYNLLIVSAFVIGGLTMFWLAYDVSKSYVGSLLAGFVFTFCSYHFIQGTSHLNLATVQWLPLWFLLWRRFLLKPDIPGGLLAAGALLLVFFSDYYYFLFSVPAGLLLWIGFMFKRRDPWYLFRHRAWPGLVSFLAVSGGIILPIIHAFMAAGRQNPFPPLDPAVPKLLSADLFAAVIPGGWWRFHELTEPYWTRLPSHIGETSIHLGVGVVLLLLAALWHHRRLRREFYLWLIVAATFYLLSFGPTLHVAGKDTGLAMPYQLLFNYVEFMRDVSTPARMMVMTTLAAGAILALAWPVLWRGRKQKWVVAGLLLVALVEFLPRQMPITEAPESEAIEVLADRPDGEIVLDLQRTFPLDTELNNFSSLYYQTLHGHPMPSGVIARTPESARDQRDAIYPLLVAGNYAAICELYDVRYLLGAGDSKAEGAVVLYRDQNSDLLDLKATGECIGR